MKKTKFNEYIFPNYGFSSSWRCYELRPPPDCCVKYVFCDAGRNKMIVINIDTESINFFFFFLGLVWYSCIRNTIMKPGILYRILYVCRYYNNNIKTLLQLIFNPNNEKNIKTKITRVLIYYYLLLFLSCTLCTI